MTIAFPTNENKGLQATRIQECHDATYFTVVDVNDKGGVTSVKSISCEEVKKMDIDYVVLSKEDSTLQCPNIFLDDVSPNVDKALVKVLREKIFKKAA